MSKKNKKKYVLVTGGAGFIGSVVTSSLINKKYDVIIVDNLSTGNKILINNKAKFFKVDLCDYPKLHKVLKNYNISTIFHFAGCLSVSESEKNPFKYYKNNVIGTQNLLKIANRKKINKFIFSSTCAVYGNIKKIRISENDITYPISNYGKTKLFAENLIINHAKLFGYKFAILRYFNVIGANINEKKGQIKSETLLKEIAKRIVNKKYIINIYGNNYATKDGTCIRDYIDVNDLSDLHILSLEKLSKHKSFIINCGYNKGYSVLNIVQIFEKILNKKIKIKFKKKRAGDVTAIYCNNNKMKSIFPKWHQKVKIEKSVKNVLLWENYLKKLIK